MATITNFDQVIVDDGVQLTNSVPSTTTNKVYNNNSQLEFNGAPVVRSDNTGISGADEFSNIVVLTEAEYDAIGSPSSSVVYLLT